MLALLKHGELLTTQGEYGEPVRLSLAPGIESFKDLRERHDSFLNMYMMDHHLFIPTVLRTELVWQLDDETRTMRLEAMDRLVLKLKLFFSSHAEYSVHAIDREAAGGASAGNANAPGGAGNATSASAADPASFKQPPYGPGGYGGRGPNNKFNNMGAPMGMQMPGGRGAGRGYVPYGGRGAGRYGYSTYYNNAGFEGPYNAGGGGYGYANNAPAGGRFGGGYAARLAQQRLANAHASATWANNEDYAELANDDWGDGDASTSAAGTGSVAGGPGASGAAGASRGAGASNSAYNSNKNNVTQLSPQAPSFDPSQLKTSTTGATTATSSKSNTSHGHHGAHNAHGGHHGHGHGHGHHGLTPKTSLHSMGDMLSFDYSRLDSSPNTLPGSVSTSRLASLNGLNLLDPKDASTGRIEASLDDGAWLAAAAAGGRSNFDFWNDSTSNFFDTLGSSNAGVSTTSLGVGGSGLQSNVVYNNNVNVNNHNNDLSFGLGELSLNRAYGSLAPAPG